MIRKCSELFCNYSDNIQEYGAIFNHVRIDGEEICCYGFGADRSGLYEHSVSRDGKYRSRECVLRIDNKKYSLVWFADFPSLFKALFNVSVKEKNDTHIIYDLDNAIVPDNYEEIDVAYSGKISFKEIVPQALQAAIIKRYQEQQKK